MKRESFPAKGVALISIRVTPRGTTVIHAVTEGGTEITYMFRDAEPKEIAELRRIVDEWNAATPPDVKWTST